MLKDLQTAKFLEIINPPQNSGEGARCYKVPQYCGQTEDNKHPIYNYLLEQGKEKVAMRVLLASALCPKIKRQNL